MDDLPCLLFMCPQQSSKRAKKACKKKRCQQKNNCKRGFPEQYFIPNSIPSDPMLCSECSLGLGLERFWSRPWNSLSDSGPTIISTLSSVKRWQIHCALDWEWHYLGLFPIDQVLIGERKQCIVHCWEFVWERKKEKTFHPYLKCTLT